MSFLDAHFLWLDIVIAAAAIAAAAGAIGVHTTLRRVVFMPAALSQLAGAGVVVAFLLVHTLAQEPVAVTPAAPVDAGTSGEPGLDSLHSHGLETQSGNVPETEPLPIPMADDPNVFAEPSPDHAGGAATGDHRSTRSEPSPDHAGGAATGDHRSTRSEPSPDHAGGAATGDHRSTRSEPSPDHAGGAATGDHRSTRSDDEHGHCPPMLPRALAMVFACLGALLLGFVREGRRVTREWLLGTVFIGASATVLLVGGFIQQELHDVNDVLFGNAIVIASGQMLEAVIVSVVIVALHLALAPAFLIHAFDPLTARAHGVPIRILDGLLFLSMGVAIATGTRVVGALPEFAFAVFPAMTALSVVRRPRLLVAVSAACGALAAFLGYWASFVLSLPTGASMAAASLLIFLVVKGAVAAAGRR
ncbi:MAG: hypothetical protein FJ109_01455 [Deltaproteobacteria bacterium]|nr:hypothetical protein [Deltaproteobacteria bacterium]